jgi:cyclopropane fatty-acyl-phospholipid synthase-like methyltransferase
VRWSGLHCKCTALQWLELLDTNRAGIDAILREVCCAEAELWRRDWRMVFLATAQCFDLRNHSS